MWRVFGDRSRRPQQSMHRAQDTLAAAQAGAGDLATPSTRVRALSITSLGGGGRGGRLDDEPSIAGREQVPAPLHRLQKTVENRRIVQNCSAVGA